jgi:hypothetical protein
MAEADCTRAAIGGRAFHVLHRLPRCRARAAPALHPTAQKTRGGDPGTPPHRAKDARRGPRHSTPPRKRRAAGTPALAVRARLPRSGKSWRLILSLRSMTRRVRDALARQTSGALMRRWWVGPARITGPELAARNRRADFPASQRVARSRRPRPSSTGTPREGSAQPVPKWHCRVLGATKFKPPKSAQQSRLDKTRSTATP